MNRPILLTMGEPAGVGPDLCVSIAPWFPHIVVAGDKNVLMERANRLGIELDLVTYDPKQAFAPDQLRVWDFTCPVPVVPGQLNQSNAQVVLDMLEKTCLATLAGEFSALVTAPVHKAHLQQVNSKFYGHTEFFMEVCGANQVVMMLAAATLRVALVTTHLPLAAVATAISQQKIVDVVKIVHQALIQNFGISAPHIAVAGLNPHAGEQGILGQEELTIIGPAIHQLQSQGFNVSGPYPADTLFLEPEVDAFIAMYHDQGLPVLKYASFGQAANISLGLPIIRTSVDHGTALGLAGSGKAEIGSLMTALEMAQLMMNARKN